MPMWEYGCNVIVVFLLYFVKILSDNLSNNFEINIETVIKYKKSGLYSSLDLSKYGGIIYLRER